MRSLITAGSILGVLTLLGITVTQPALGTGSISGKVVLNGSAPQPKTVEVTKNKEVCGGDKLAGDLIVGADKGVQNAVVSLNGLKGETPTPTQTPALDQNGCEFKPRVVIVPVGTPMNILNNDVILHNIHTHSTKNRAFNQSQPKFRKKMARKFDQAEIFKVTCDVHSWMTGWIVVTDSPYVVATDVSGTFKIEGVPAGTHTLEVWHETLGRVTQEVTVTDGQATDMNIELTN